MRKSFTLIEMLIAITIFSFIYLVMSDTLGKLKHSEDFIKRHYKKFDKKEKILKTLYMDMLKATFIKVVQRDNRFSTLYLRTENSLYNLSYPFVLWYVTGNGNLIRVESADRRLLPLEKIGYLYDFGKVKIFKIYQKKNRFFIFYKNKKPLYFEFYKG
jgi:prepilin-type N-terminal cleavage/methylation domain-containing protein